MLNQLIILFTEFSNLLPSTDTNKNNAPEVTPFKPQFSPVRVQKQTPKPIIEQVVTVRPVLQFSPTVAAVVAPVVPVISANYQNDPNSYGSPGPFVGQLYLPPNNDYLPPGSAVPARAAYSAQTDFLAAPQEQLVAAGSSVFQYN